MIRQVIIAFLGIAAVVAWVHWKNAQNTSVKFVLDEDDNTFFETSQKLRALGDREFSLATAAMNKGKLSYAIRFSKHAATAFKRAMAFGRYREATQLSEALKSTIKAKDKTASLKMSVSVAKAQSLKEQAKVDEAQQFGDVVRAKMHVIVSKARTVAKLENSKVSDAVKAFAVAPDEASDFDKKYAHVKLAMLKASKGPSADWLAVPENSNQQWIALPVPSSEQKSASQPKSIRSRPTPTLKSDKENKDMIKELRRKAYDELKKADSAIVQMELVSGDQESVGETASQSHSTSELSTPSVPEASWAAIPVENKQSGSDVAKQEAAFAASLVHDLVLANPKMDHFSSKKAKFLSQGVKKQKLAEKFVKSKFISNLPEQISDTGGVGPVSADQAEKVAEREQLKQERDERCQACLEHWTSEAKACVETQCRLHQWPSSLHLVGSDQGDTDEVRRRLRHLDREQLRLNDARASLFQRYVGADDSQSAEQLVLVEAYTPAWVPPGGRPVPGWLRHASADSLAQVGLPAAGGSRVVQVQVHDVSGAQLAEKLTMRPAADIREIGAGKEGLTLGQVLRPLDRQQMLINKERASLLASLVSPHHAAAALALLQPNHPAPALLQWKSAPEALPQASSPMLAKKSVASQAKALPAPLPAPGRPSKPSAVVASPVPAGSPRISPPAPAAHGQAASPVGARPAERELVAEERRRLLAPLRKLPAEVERRLLEAERARLLAPLDLAARLAHPSASSPASTHSPSPLVPSQPMSPAVAAHLPDSVARQAGVEQGGLGKMGSKAAHAGLMAYFDALIRRKEAVSVAHPGHPH